MKDKFDFSLVYAGPAARCSSPTHGSFAESWGPGQVQLYLTSLFNIFNFLFVIIKMLQRSALLVFYFYTILFYCLPILSHILWTWFHVS